MSRRGRLAEILAAARAADAQAGLERSRGQREAANVGAWGNVANTAINAAASAAPKAIAAAEDSEVEKLSQDLITKNRGKIGSLLSKGLPDGVEGPATEAQTAESDRLKANPLAAARYTKTSGETAKDLVGADAGAKDEEGFAGILRNGVKARARRMAEASLAGDIDSRRKAADVENREAVKYQTERADKDRSFDLDTKKFKQSDEHFGKTQTQQSDLAKLARQHAERMQGNSQAFTRDVVIPHQDSRASELAKAQSSTKDEQRVVSEPTVLKLKEKQGVVDNFKSIGLQAEKLPDGSFGKIAGMEAFLRKVVDADETDRRLLADQLGDLAAKKLKIQTGTGVTAAEKKEFTDRFLSDMNNPELFAAKLRQLTEEAVDDHNRDLSGLRDAGYNTRRLAPVSSPSSSRRSSSEQQDDAAQFQE